MSLSNVVTANLTARSVDVAVDTNVEDGTLIIMVDNTASAPELSLNIAGFHADGSYGTYYSRVAVLSAGTKTFSVGGLLPATAYYAHIVHVDAAGNSSVLSSSAITTTTVTYTEIWVDLDAGSNGVGTEADPKNVLTGTGSGVSNTRFHIKGTATVTSSYFIQGSELVFTNWNSEAPAHFDASGDTALSKVFSLSGCTNATFDNVKVTASSRVSGIALGFQGNSTAQGVFILNCELICPAVVTTYHTQAVQIAGFGPYVYKDNTITGFATGFNTIQPASGQPAYLMAEISGNTITCVASVEEADNSDGISLGSETTEYLFAAAIYGNNCTGWAENGIDIARASEARIFNNSVSANSTLYATPCGMFLGASDNAVGGSEIFSNIFFDILHSGAAQAINSRGGVDCEIYGNVFENCDRGCNFNSNGNAVHNNTFSNTVAHAIYVQAGVTSGVITNNVFKGSGSGNIFVGTGSTATWSYNKVEEGSNGGTGTLTDGGSNTTSTLLITVNGEVLSSTSPVLAGGATWWAADQTPQTYGGTYLDGNLVGAVPHVVSTSRGAINTGATVDADYTGIWSTVSWTTVGDNSLSYPMSEGVGGAGTLRAYNGLQEPATTYDAPITNYDSTAWGY
tara:strand:- start:53 stop:1927 length:1875 start_codon:yes stop_codon:yes gene_type:complete